MIRSLNGAMRPDVLNTIYDPERHSTPINEAVTPVGGKWVLNGNGCSRSPSCFSCRKKDCDWEPNDIKPERHRPRLTKKELRKRRTARKKQIASC